MNYWAFGTHSEQPPLAEKQWRVFSKRMGSGDRACLWKFRGDGKNRGIVGFAEVLSAPYYKEGQDQPYYVDDQLRIPPQLWVDVRCFKTAECPVWLEEHPELAELSIAKTSGHSVYIVKPEQWQQILDLCGRWKP
jgi:predicted RNA-binding protein with PUA-like domain